MPSRRQIAPALRTLLPQVRALATAQGRCIAQMCFSQPRSLYPALGILAPQHRTILCAILHVCTGHFQTKHIAFLCAIRSAEFLPPVIQIRHPLPSRIPTPQRLLCAGLEILRPSPARERAGQSRMWMAHGGRSRGWGGRCAWMTPCATLRMESENSASTSVTLSTTLVRGVGSFVCQHAPPCMFLI